MEKLNNTQKRVAIALFFFLIGLFCSLIIILLPKWMIIGVIIIVFIGMYFVYTKFMVKILGLEMAWWSPHPKRIDLTDEIFGEIDPEIMMVLYFLDNNFKRYYRIKKKRGFVIGGNNKGIDIRARFKDHHLKINFSPHISKKTIDEMKRFKKHLVEIKI